MSVAQNVLFRLNRKQLGTPFHICSFYDLGSETSVQKAFSRMVQDGVVARLTKGFYARPKPVASLPVSNQQPVLMQSHVFGPRCMIISWSAKGSIRRIAWDFKPKPRSEQFIGVMVPVVTS